MKEKGGRKRGEDADGVSILPPTHPALPPPSYPQPNQPYLPISLTHTDQLTSSLALVMM